MSCTAEGKQPGRVWCGIKLSTVKWKTRKGGIEATPRSADAIFYILDCVDLHNCNLIKDDMVHGNECCVGRTGDSRWQCTQWPDQCNPYEILSALFFLSEMDKLPLIFI